MFLLLMNAWGVANATEVSWREASQERVGQFEVMQPLHIVSVPSHASPRLSERAETLFDLYFDEDRPFIGGSAYESIEEAVDILHAHPEAKLSLATYCDQRSSTAYGMALSNQRTRQVQEFLQDLDILSVQIVTGSYGNEALQCGEKNFACWEERGRFQSAFKYLAISHPKLGCFVRVGVMGEETFFYNIFLSKQTTFLQKITLAPVLKRRRLSRYVFHSTSTSPSSQMMAFQ